MTRHDLQLVNDGPRLPEVMDVFGHELQHAAELLRRYEKAVLERQVSQAVRQGGASELQLVDLVIQILEDMAPFSQDLAKLMPEETRVPESLIDRLRLDQLRAVMGGSEIRDAPHSGGDIDVF
ncbi:hypothetical protein [Rhodovulum sulfidophilum]|uniref:hypothetical protein n=1 Tax=Rhodovulum sulfidophilum TaxID=35806 RepID=UPI001922EB0F|nr:hypothetical protein [Rhodovulum sulfidophilum]MBL3561836.1 hypothetical protein [Rhodovulum sulfidophilum]